MNPIQRKRTKLPEMLLISLTAILFRGAEFPGTIWAAEQIAAIGQQSFPDVRIESQTEYLGRKVTRYEHSSADTWGYKVRQTDSFYVVHPKSPQTNSALCVVLHSAGGKGDEALGPHCKKHFERGFYGDESYYVLCLDCAQNRNDWWWGFESIQADSNLYQNELCPAETRVLATIEWVVTTFGIDRNRIHLNGISMGGSGTLGIGFNHGDVFASAAVIVPAGVKHLQFRTLDKTFPDPPVLVNISSHVDSWAKEQESLLEFCQANQYLVAFSWGPFGHTNDVRSANPAVYDYP